jgi:hypothetical protein
MNIDVKKHQQFLNNIPEFYKTVLTSWIKTGGSQLSSPLTFINKLIVPDEIIFFDIYNAFCF